MKKLWMRCTAWARKHEFRLHGFVDRNYANRKDKAAVICNRCGHNFMINNIQPHQTVTLKNTHGCKGYKA